MKRITLKKRTLNNSLMVTNAGQIVTDQIRLPHGCRKVVGIRVTPTKAASPPHDVSFMDIYYYWGVGAEKTDLDIDAAFVVANLDKKRFESQEFEEYGNAGLAEYLYYVHPTADREPIFTFNNTTGGFIKLSDNIVISENGANVTYTVWRSTNANLAQVEVNIENKKIA